MSSFGSQSITYNLSESFEPGTDGVRQYNIIPYGIYDGLELSIDGPDTVQISGPGVGVIYDEVNNLAVQYQQHDNYIKTVSPTEPYLIARWEYNQSLTNPVRYETDTQAGLASTDVILGKVLFDQNDEVSGFDLSERVERDLENVEGFDTEADEGALYQSDGNGNVITVLSTQSNNTLARYNDSSGEWEAIQTDTSNTGNTVVERTSDGSVNAQDVNADGSVSAGSSSSVNGTIQHSDANNDNESATLGQVKSFAGQIVASGTIQLSSGSAVVSTGETNTSNTYYLALGVQDPNTDTKISGRLFWDDSAGEHKVEIIETDTSVGNPTAVYKVVNI
jgi:hypothetical protein